jgi:hypothetical protein
LAKVGAALMFESNARLVSRDFQQLAARFIIYSAGIRKT